MIEVSLGELQQDTSALIRRVAAGEQITVTVNGRPSVGLVPLSGGSRRWIPRDVLAQRLRVASADPQMREDLQLLAGETTDDLPSLP